ncbi:MAG: peptidylprolyl isomerase [Acidimicrobiales bacterium]
MPSEKRARKRAQREAKMAALARQRKRQAGVRRAITIVVLVAVAVGIYVAVTSGGKKKVASAPKTSTTTTSTLPAGAVSTTTSVNLAGDTTSANCPRSFSGRLKKPSWRSAPPTIIDQTKSYTATVTTDVGSFTIALDTSAAPKTVNNFVFLAENHFYDCAIFYRVVPDFMDQTGDPKGDGSGGPGYKFADENIPTGSYTAGELAMANFGPNTNGSQFFVLVAKYNPPSPTDKYSVFGQVTSGMSVVQKINSDGSSSSTGVPPKVLHRMVSVIISES